MGEPLWHSLKAILLGTMECSRDWMVVQKQLKAASPSVIPMLHDASDRLSRELHVWVEGRVPPGERFAAQLQLNIALSAVLTAFDQWDVAQPFETFLETTRDYLDQIGHAFSTD